MDRLGSRSAHALSAHHRTPHRSPRSASPHRRIPRRRATQIPHRLAENSLIRTLLEAVRRREVDFAIGPVPEKKGELEFAPIFVDDYCAMLPRGYQDNGRASISLRELSKLPLLKLSSSTAFRDHVDNALKANGLSHDSNYEFTQVTTLVAMAEAGLGIALLPRVALPRRTPLKVVRIIGPALSRTIAVVTIRGHSLSPAAARLVEMCNQLIAPE
ncbi:LysR substrate-binding domain-containing protein [Variovorax sp.]|uniref:LysR substrate-binding domain-containing protein n=1 Tax=Variovorax sp. TaxID=1871043 RepID=UPI003BAADDDE